MSRAYTKGFATELKAANQTPTQMEKIVFRLLEDIILFMGQLIFLFRMLAFGFIASKIPPCVLCHLHAMDSLIHVACRYLGN